MNEHPIQWICAIFWYYILKFRAWTGFSIKIGQRQAPVTVFNILSATAVKPHLTTWREKVRFPCSGAQNLENLLGSLSRPILERNIERSSKFQYQMGLVLPDLKNHSKSVKRFRLKNGKSWCLANEQFRGIPGFPSSHSRFPESSSHSRFPYSGFLS